MKFQGVLNSLFRWGNQKIFVEKLNNVLGYTIFAAIAFIISYLSSIDISFRTGIIFLLTVFALPTAIFCFIYPIIGFCIALFFSSTIFLLNRLFGDMPFTIGIDALVLISLLGLLSKGRLTIKGAFFNPITIVLMIWVLYGTIQLFNPNLISYEDTFMKIRGTILFTISYFFFYLVSQNPYFVKTFFISWIVLAFIASLYALYQEHFGLPWYDLRWVTSTEELIGLNFISGRWRKWSFFSDCTAFGIFMAFSSVAFIILFLGPTSLREKMGLAVVILMTLMAMVYSGTRTAYAMIPAGLSIYFLLTIDHTRTIISSVLGAILLGAIIFGPFYGPNINRLRSTILPSKDASFEVRELNRSRIQPYLQTHPFGGGSNSTGTFGLAIRPTHELAGFPPDSGYLKDALEFGWIGLILRFTYFAVILITGIVNLFRVQNEIVKYYYLAIIAGFFSLTIAYFAQVSIFQYPMPFLVYTIYALIINLRHYDSWLSSNQSLETNY